MNDEDLKLEDIEASHTLGGAGDVGRGEGEEYTHYIMWHTMRYALTFLLCMYIGALGNDFDFRP
jgi:hypothetical protein